MAIMAVKIEDARTLRMNEFFDYNGTCYAISRSRTGSSPAAADLEDFYECTVFTDWVEDVPVLFLTSKEAEDELYICGWYRKARICRKVSHPTLFLEGNIKARAMDAVLLPKAQWAASENIFSRDDMLFRDKLYRVIEEDDPCYEKAKAWIESKPADALPVRFELFLARVDKAGMKAALSGKSLSGKSVEKTGSVDGRSRASRSGGKNSMADRRKLHEYCIEKCGSLALRLMQDECGDIGEIKTLREYAGNAIVYDSKNPDGYYYRAMAEEQLGFVKEGLKSVNKALDLEPDGADILALKANLLTALGKYKEAVDLYGESYDISGDESYLLAKGRVFFLMGNVDAAYKTYHRIRDKSLLEEAGINLKDMEHRWPFVAIRGLKSLLKR